MIQPAGSTLRLFTGIAATPEIHDRLDALVRRLKPLADIRWSPTANFHITTKFIGAWPEAKLNGLKDALAAMPLSPSSPATIRIRSLDFFPNPQSPRIFWVGVDGGEPLRLLAELTDGTCHKLGIPVEDKPYKPHLTLARIDRHKSVSALQTAVGKEPAEFGQFEAKSFHLYRSQPGPRGSIYTSLAEFAL